MRRVTVQKTPIRTSNSRKARDEAAERPAERPEIRKDIRKTWWPG